jgi:hypothetical protein
MDLLLLLIIALIILSIAGGAFISPLVLLLLIVVLLLFLGPYRGRRTRIEMREPCVASAKPIPCVDTACGFDLRLDIGELQDV